MKPPVVCIIGSPSSGKRTQALLLAQSLHVPQATMGKLLAGLSIQPTDMGRRLQAAIRAGSMIDGRFFGAVLTDLLAEYVSTGVVIDGYPRTLEQAEQLLHLREGMETLVVMDLVLSDAEANRRIIERLKEPGHIQRLSERSDILDEKRLMHSLSQPRLSRALLKGEGAGQCSYVKLVAEGTIQEVHQAVLDTVARLVPVWKQVKDEVLAPIPA